MNFTVPYISNTPLHYLQSTSRNTFTQNMGEHFQRVRGDYSLQNNQTKSFVFGGKIREETLLSCTGGLGFIFSTAGFTVSATLCDVPLSPAILKTEFRIKIKVKVRSRLGQGQSARMDG